MSSRHNECIISIVHQHCDDLSIGGGTVPEGSVWRGRKDAWFLASFAGGSGGVLVLLLLLIFLFFLNPVPLSHETLDTHTSILGLDTITNLDYSALSAFLMLPSKFTVRIN